MAMKNDKQPREASYYQLHTDAVEDLVSATKENTPRYSEEELNKYRSGKTKRKFPQWLKVLGIKTWFYGAVCFFVFWGLGMYLADQWDLYFVAGIVLGMVTDLLINWYVQEIDIPNRAEDENAFDPYDEDQVDLKSWGGK